MLITPIFKGCILLAWLYSIFWMTLVIVKNGFYLEGILISCTFDYLSRDFHSRFLMMDMFIGGFLMPLLVIILFFNIKLASKRSLTRNSNSQKDISHNKIYSYKKK